MSSERRRNRPQSSDYHPRIKPQHIPSEPSQPVCSLDDKTSSQEIYIDSAESFVPGIDSLPEDKLDSTLVKQQDFIKQIKVIR
jgi:hypothetical protein